MDGGAPSLARQSLAAMEAKSAGCISCHRGIEPMHVSSAVRLGCVDCHGGDASVRVSAGIAQDSAEAQDAKRAAHVAPRDPDLWYDTDGRSPAANPRRSYTDLVRESVEFVRFVNPGDLRVAQQNCGSCHQKEVNAVLKSPMTTSSIFWAAAAYANGILPLKGALLGESYGARGETQQIAPIEALTIDDLARGARSLILPLPRFEVTQPGEYFRAFEKGGILVPAVFPEIGNPNPIDEAGRPDVRFSNRGRGTGLRVSPGVTNLHKTRLNDPHLSFLGTNDHPGDFRSSGCTACHVVYANDREIDHSGPWAVFGNLGESRTGDPTIRRGEQGHPIAHRFTRAIPSSQCMTCHHHQPNSFVNTYLGYTMWDYETDGELLWPEQQAAPTAAETRASLDHNPEAAAARGKWSDLGFLARVWDDVNPRAKKTQFADYHGHGWLFRAVFKRDRKGQLLDRDGAVVPFEAPDALSRAVHLKDIHVERGMHCADCHFSRDAHGDGLIHGEYGDAIEIACEDCHGSIRDRSSLRTSGPASPLGGTDLALGTTPWGKRRFSWRQSGTGVELVQRSMLYEDCEWVVPQIADGVAAKDGERARGARAHSMQRDGSSWGDPEVALQALAHPDSRMTCDSCHSSWVTNCFGCHLPQEANVKSDVQHFEGGTTRNYASYNPQVVRADGYMLGIDGTVKGNRVAPVRSSSGLVLSSINLNRQRVYIQQPPISAPGFSSQAFNPHVPHTVRSTEAKSCSDCHLSEQNDNNAWMAQLLLLGTRFVDFVGRYAWVGLGTHGVEAVAVTEWTEPQAVIGSYLHRLAYPANHARHEEEGRELEESHHHPGRGEIRSLQLRGEFLHVALGKGGYRVYDVANIDNKDFSERIVTAPVSPFGQRAYVRTRDAAAVALPTNQPMAPSRTTSDDYPENQEQPIHPLYRYAFIADREEGVVLVNVDTLTNGVPTDNFLRRETLNGEASFNPEGRLKGARAITVAGNHVFVGCDAGLVVVDFTTPTAPRIVATLDEIEQPTAVQVQFRYAFVTDAKGLAVVDVTDPAAPRLAARTEAIADARGLHVARTYAYVAAGKQGLVIVDVEKPEQPRIDQVFDAGGEMNDAWDVTVGSTNASLFAYVADGEHGLRVLQLTSPERTPTYLGFSPRPEPQLIATRHTHGEAKALSRGLQRDRAVDESGNQIAVFNRIGARPFNLQEMHRLYLRDGRPYTVSDAEPARARSEAGAPPPCRKPGGDEGIAEASEP
jgi:hypothetical protein